MLFHDDAGSKPVYSAFIAMMKLSHLGVLDTTSVKNVHVIVNIAGGSLGVK